MNRRAFLSTTMAATGASVFSPAWAQTSPIKVAVVGHTGQGNYGHDLDTVWLKLPQVCVVGVADADEKGLHAAKQKLGVDVGFSDYQKLFEATRPEVVSVAPRWVHEHSEIILAGLQHGAKAFYVEKPFCRTLEEADRIVKALKAHGAVLAVAHRNRYHPALPVVKQLLEDGKIGQVLEMRGRGKEDQRGGGLDLWVLGSHVLNLAQALAGKPLSCSAEMRQNGKLLTAAQVVPEGPEGTGALGGDELHARYTFENGWVGYFDSLKSHGHKDAGFGLQIIGTEGVIDLRVDETPFAHYAKGNPHDPQARREPWIPISSAGIGVPEPHPEQIRKVASHEAAIEDLLLCLKQGGSPLCNENEGRDTLEMIFGVFESHKQGGKSVSLPLQDRKNPFDSWL